VKVETLSIGTGKRRAEISKAKKEFVQAIEKAVYDLREFSPIADRKVHYMLTKSRPRRHMGKPDNYIDKKGKPHHNRYFGDKECYKATCELLTRLRLSGAIPFEAIGGRNAACDDVGSPRQRQLVHRPADE
jgi:hypothetical protein